MELRTLAGPLSRGDRDAVRGLVGRATAADGVAPLDEAALLALADEGPASPGGARHVLAFLGDGTDPRSDAGTSNGSGAGPGTGVHDGRGTGAGGGFHAAAGRVVGYAHVDRGGAVPTAQVVVDPLERRRGVGRALLEAAAAGGAHAPDVAPGPLEAWAHGNLPAARGLAAAAGFVPVHELWRMAADLVRHAPAEPAWPAGCAVRPFVPGRDEAAWLAVNAAAFADHAEQGRWTAHDLAAREREPWFDPAGFLLAHAADGALVGFVWTKVHPAGELADEQVGEVYVLGVAPTAQGAGLGRALTAAGLAHLVGRGLRTAVLWVAGDNAAAIRTYRRAGFERAALDVRYARRAGGGAMPPDGATMGS